MGIYLNSGNMDFEMIKNSDIYVDKSLLIEYTNSILRKSNRFVCVSRPRRFGKSTDANMLVAYYSKGCDSKELFKDLKIAKRDSYNDNLNKYNVIHLNMQEFLSDADSIYEMIEILNEEVIYELSQCYTVKVLKHNLKHYLKRIFSEYNETFIFVIDEWDCIFREYQEDKEAQEKYLDFLRDLLKDKPYVSLAYMTGILPIKKYGTHSALNMFKEISMLNPTPLEVFMGFTEIEVKQLCNEYQMDFEEMKTWYDGYHLNDDFFVCAPISVVRSLQDKKYENYWTSTETYEALRIYIDKNIDGLKDDIIRLLAGERVYIDVGAFQNDMTTFKSKDDILTLLVHLGYLGYDNVEKKVYIPNHEVTDSFIQSVKNSKWDKVTTALLNSQALLEATWKLDGEAVADYIENAHFETSILTYNNETALSYVISLAYYMARNYYDIEREMPGGKGFADLVFKPLKDKPAMIVELKWDKTAESAIDQIKEKKYFKGIEKYLDNLLLVGISYDKNKGDKKHSCIIEKYKK